MKVIFADLSPKDREEQLKNMAEKVETRTYEKPLTEEQITEEKLRYFDDNLRLEKHVENFKEVKKEHDDEKKVIEQQIEERKQKIQHCKVEVTGKVFLCPNHEEKRMRVYDINGILVEDRKLTPNEENMTMFNASGQPFSSKGERDVNVEERIKDFDENKKEQEEKKVKKLTPKNKKSQ